MGTATITTAGETVAVSYQLGGVTHGDQITVGNTGPRVPLTVVSGSLTLTGSNIASRCTGTGTAADPYVFAGKNVTGDLTVTAPNVYLIIRDCLAVSVLIPLSRVGPLVRVEWSGIGSRSRYVGGTSGLVAMTFDLYRCWVAGGSDALRMQAGGSIATECHLRVRQGSPTDHNDTIQNYGARGDLTVRRCNIDAYLYEVGENGSGVYQGGDYGPTDSPMVQTIRFEDNYVDGAGIHWGLYGGDANPNLRYVVTGNKHGRIGQPYTYTTSKANDATPRSQIIWERNTYADTGAVVPFG